MELDTFLASPRWEILQKIITKPSSPLEISKELGTTISFVSQQLKLLEAARFVKKEKTGEVEKGKPRSLFSITKEVAYIIPLAKEFENKKLIDLNPRRKIILKIWGLENQKIQEPIERFFWNLEEGFEGVDAVILSKKKIIPKIFFFSSKKELASKVKEAQKKVNDIEAQVIDSMSHFSKAESKFCIPLYDPNGIFNENLKGGENDNE